MNAWPAPTIEPPSPEPPSPRSASSWVFIVAGLIVPAVVVAGLAVFVRGGSDEAEFERRRIRAEELEARAASAKSWIVGVSAHGWARVESRVDRASRSVATDLWQGDGDPDTSTPPILSLLSVGGERFIRSPRFDDPSSTEPTWYLNEDSSGMTPEAFEAHISGPWDLLDDADDAPRRVGTEHIDGEQLDRFDLSIPADAFERGVWITIDYVGLVDPSNGLDLSFWFSDEGELRRLTVEGDGDSGSSSYEYWSKLSVDSTPIDAPAAPRSWRQLRALHD